MKRSIDPSVENFIAGLPKTETHLHIEGALPWQLLLQLDEEKFSERPKSWHDDFRFDSFAQFEEELIGYAGHWFTSVDRYYEAAKFLLGTLFREENVRYVETSFASAAMETFGLDGDKVSEAIVSAAPEGMEVRVFMGIHHNGYTDTSRDFLESSLFWPHLTGLDLHGTESFPLEPWTADLWERARAAGKITKAHAGEFCGPEFVRRVVDELGVRRIQHGVRSAEEPQLLEYLAEKGVSFDVCPISNVKLGVVSSIEAHPIRKIIESGIPCTVNTDDPVSFGNRLQDEYRVLHSDAGFSVKDLLNVARTGFELSLVDNDKRGQWLKDFDRYAEDWS